MDFEPIDPFQGTEKGKETPQLTDKLVREQKKISNSLPSHPSPELFLAVKELPKLYLRALNTNRVSELLRIIIENYPQISCETKTPFPPIIIPPTLPTSTPNPMDSSSVMFNQLNEQKKPLGFNDVKELMSSQINRAIKEAENKLEGEAGRILKQERERREKEARNMKELVEDLKRSIEIQREKDPRLIHRMDQSLEEIRVDKTPVPTAFIQAFM